jgi:hypothetical protein
LAALDDPLAAVGQTVQGAHGVWLKVVEANREPNGQVKLHVQIQAPEQDTGNESNPWMNQGFPWRMNRRAFFWRQPGGNGDLPNLELRSANGQIYQRVDDPSIVQAGWNGMPVVNPGPRDYRLTFLPPPGRGEPARLVYLGRRIITVEVPFTLKDVPLP